MRVGIMPWELSHQKKRERPRPTVSDVTELTVTQLSEGRKRFAFFASGSPVTQSGFPLQASQPEGHTALATGVTKLVADFATKLPKALNWLTACVMVRRGSEVLHR